MDNILFVQKDMHFTANPIGWATHMTCSFDPSDSIARKRIEKVLEFYDRTAIAKASIMDFINVLASTVRAVCSDLPPDVKPPHASLRMSERIVDEAELVCGPLVLRILPLYQSVRPGQPIVCPVPQNNPQYQPSKP